MTTFEHTLQEAGDGPCVHVTRLNPVCPNPVQFTIRLSRAQKRKAWLACQSHLVSILWKMRLQYGGYDGEFVITAGQPQWEIALLREQEKRDGRKPSDVGPG